MGQLQYHHQYRRNAISTSGQERLIIMMYEGAIKFTTMAIQSIDEGDIAGQGKYISKTHDIISELSLALDIEKKPQTKLEEPLVLTEDKSMELLEEEPLLLTEEVETEETSQQPIILSPAVRKMVAEKNLSLIHI